jgi:hypothetical protein
VRRKDLIAGIIIIVALAALFIPFASEAPDGLERVAGDKGFFPSASGTARSPFAAPFPDYRIPGMGDKTSGVVSGIAGALAMFCIGWGIAALLKKMRAR